jgi:hypothetical protein
VIEKFADPIEDADGFGGDFGADAVAREDGQLIMGHKC